MALFWGVIPREMPAMHDTDELVDWCTGDLLAAGLRRRPGERVVIVFGAPIGVSGSTNSHPRPRPRLELVPEPAGEC